MALNVAFMPVTYIDLYASLDADNELKKILWKTEVFFKLIEL